MEQGTRIIVNGESFDFLLDKNEMVTANIDKVVFYSKANLSYKIKAGDQVIIRHAKQF